MLDLTPFGFTPTETQAYGALLTLGPSSGYAVARALSVARANAYQALDGLVTKGAATVVSEGSPRRYRAVQPRTVFALVLEAQTQRLDELELQLMAQPAQGTAPLITLRGERALTDAVVRAVVRTPGEVTLLASSNRLGAITPALRARVAAGRPLRLWVFGTGSLELPVLAGQVDPDRAASLLPDEALLLIADGVLAAEFGNEPQGIWSEASMIVALVRAAVAALTT